MRLKKWIAASAMAGFVLAAGSAAAATATTYMIEILPLKQGATVEAAGQYFADVSPIIAAHGIFPVQAYRVADPKAEGAAQVINVWRVADPKGFDGIFADPEYLKHVKDRDSIFDLSKRVGWMTQELY